MLQKTMLHDLADINHFLREMNRGGIYRLSMTPEHYEESLTFEFTCDGGVFETVSLFIQFLHVQLMHVGVSMDSTFTGVQIDEVRSVSQAELGLLIPHPIDLDPHANFYQFYAQQQPTAYYVLSSEIHAWVEGHLNQQMFESNV